MSRVQKIEATKPLWGKQCPKPNVPPSKLASRSLKRHLDPERPSLKPKLYLHFAGHAKHPYLSSVRETSLQVPEAKFS